MNKMTKKERARLKKDLEEIRLQIVLDAMKELMQSARP